MSIIQKELSNEIHLESVFDVLKIFQVSILSWGGNLLEKYHFGCKLYLKENQTANWLNLIVRSEGTSTTF